MIVKWQHPNIYSVGHKSIFPTSILLLFCLTNLYLKCATSSVRLSMMCISPTLFNSSKMVLCGNPSQVWDWSSLEAVRRRGVEAQWQSGLRPLELFAIILILLLWRFCQPAPLRSWRPSMTTCLTLWFRRVGFWRRPSPPWYIAVSASIAHRRKDHS